MFTFILIFLILLPVASLPLALTSFSSTELDEMGVCLENIDVSSCEEQPFQPEPFTMKMTIACGNL